MEVERRNDYSNKFLIDQGFTSEGGASESSGPISVNDEVGMKIND